MKRETASTGLAVEGQLEDRERRPKLATLLGGVPGANSGMCTVCKHLVDNLKGRECIAGACHYEIIALLFRPMRQSAVARTEAREDFDGALKKSSTREIFTLAGLPRCDHGAKQETTAVGIGNHHGIFVMVIDAAVQATKAGVGFEVLDIANELLDFHEVGTGRFARNTARSLLVAVRETEAEY